MSQKKQVAISMPDISSAKYKLTVKEIQESVNELNSFTNNLQQKMNMMLKGQQTEFVNSYKNHMSTIEEALKDYQHQIKQNKKKIEYYQNQGVLSTLLNKISFLQAQEKKLLDKLDKKDRVILDLKHQISTQNKEISSLRERVKDFVKNSTVVRRVRDSDYRQQKQSERTFATEIPHSILKSNQSLQKIIPQQTKQSQNEWRDSLLRARNQVQTLKKRNRQLSSVNSRIIDKNGQIDQFFMKILNQLKRKIATRKNFSPCTYQDFKQQDKLQLLVKVLSNQEVLQHLYEKIFHKQQSAVFSTLVSEQMDSKTKSMLPSIMTTRKN